MYLNIGGEYQIPVRTIIGLFDFDKITEDSGDYNLELLSQKEEDLMLETVSEDLPRSLIITETKYYLSPINVSTLAERIREPWNQV
jgi:hypothetical protein